MGRLASIAIGWGKAMGLMQVTEEERKLSEERLKVCEECPFATESRVLMMLRGGADHVQILKCERCGCPVNEKSLVEAERCPAAKWKR